MKSRLNAEQDSGYTARYLVLLSNSHAQRALLFGMDHHYLTEVIGDDDGLVLDNLKRAGRACVTPPEIEQGGLTALLASDHVDVRCFALG